MKVDKKTVIDAVGRNEQVKKVFWTRYAAMARRVIDRVCGPGDSRQVVRAIMGIGM